MAFGSGIEAKIVGARDAAARTHNEKPQSGRHVGSQDVHVIWKLSVILTTFAVVGCESAPPRRIQQHTAARSQANRPLRLADNPVARMEIIQGMRRNPLPYCRHRFIGRQRILAGRRRLLVGIRGKSMAPTLREGDLIITIKPDRDPEPGDIIVFSSPDGRNRLIVKRIVATPSGRVGLRNGVLAVNGEEVRQSPPMAWRLHDIANMCRRGDAGSAAIRQHRLANGRSFPILACDGRRTAPRNFEEIRVPYRHVFVMGDNRDRSVDSRRFGTLSQDNIVGLVACIAGPA
jgi:signal peptidase I